MSNTINKLLQDPDYIKWRKKNPPNAKPVMYEGKYFRSIQEVVNYFGFSRGKIDRDLLKGKKNCKMLDPNKSYNFEINQEE